MTPQFPEALHVSGSGISSYSDEPWEEIEKDPRGLLLMWHPPRKNAKYIMGLDATEGITGWSRAARTTEDHKTDNGAIEIFEVDGIKEPVFKIEAGNRVPDVDPDTEKQRILYRDLQVAEFAAPCDAVEIARIANILGRIYAGDAEDQCELIWEAWPGVGMLATQELLRLGYGNLWMWEYISSAAEETNHMGWRSTRESQRILWYRARRHLMNRQAKILSKFLLAEYTNAQIDLVKMRATAAPGFHDDRFMAANMCFWAGHKWTYEVERTDEKVTERPNQDYQIKAMVLDDYESYTDWKSNATADWD